MMAATDFPLPDTSWPPLREFWAGAADHRLRLPRCVGCRRFRWYPTGDCPHCRGDRLEWEDLSGRGTLFSWSVVRRALEPALAVLQPYVSAIVVPEEAPCVRIVSRLVDCEEADLRADAPVVVRFADLAYPAAHSGVVAPLFTLDRSR
jgi:uncharacterized OB-fold protein